MSGPGRRPWPTRNGRGTRRSGWPPPLRAAVAIAVTACALSLALHSQFLGLLAIAAALVALFVQQAVPKLLTLRYGGNARMLELLRAKGLRA